MYELTQRKFLRQLIQISDKQSTIKSYPRLFCIDLIHESKVEECRRLKNQILKQKKAQDKEETGEDIKDSLKKEVSELIEENTTTSKMVPCVRILCEHEESWHLSETFVLLTEMSSIFSPYLARIMTIIKSGSGSSELMVFLSDKGRGLLEELEFSAKNETIDLAESYTSLRNYVISEIEKDNFYLINNKPKTKGYELDLLNCELKNGKIVWLCKNHTEKLNAKVISDQKASAGHQFDQTKNKMLQDIETINIEII